MTLKRTKWPAGELLELEHDSRILRDNPLGDPHIRKLHVWLPPHYNSGKKRFPVMYDLVGYTGSGLSHTGWKNFEENVPERVARLVHEKKMAPAILVFPDCFTALGGNQYINSSAIGNYADYLTREIIPFVDGELRTLASRDSRACFGKSSGGYGAIVHGMKYPRYWGAVADHSGDAYFDFVYRSDWPNTLDELAKYRRPPRKEGAVDVAKSTQKLKPGLDDGRVKHFLEAFWAKSKPSGAEVMCLMNLAMAASYDPAPSAPNGFRLPFDLETGELIPARWKRWLANDPIHMARTYRANLKTLHGIFIDCGWKDQYHIHYGSRILSRELAKLGVKHVYEEFDDNHSGIDYRMERSLPFLSRALKKS
ncbi:MAG: alpha/beta hydrolase-fold protein [Halieaceae bacterium]|jgi:enterochelin esterase-like enzyme|nr:alpha/beta hydrolase-fold protein [Halieaceae bacterium]